MICTNSTTPLPPSSSLVSISVVAERFGLCQETLRRWDSQGKIRSFRANKNCHRRFSLSEISQTLGLEEKKEENQGKIPVVYARTSSLSQKESLKGQIERMKGEVSKAEGIPAANVKVYSDNASAYGDRPGINNLVQDAIDNKTVRYISFGKIG